VAPVSPFAPVAPVAPVGPQKKNQRIRMHWRLMFGLAFA
jgi:hypothetical protein